MTVLRHQEPAVSRAIESATGPVATLLASWKAHQVWRRTYKTTRNELSQLGDRELADIGLNRSAIDATAMEAADMAVARI